jgi:TonB-linked SusC/RagA family outer membrane protein
MKKLLNAIPFPSRGINKLLKRLAFTFFALCIGVIQVNGHLYSQGAINLNIEGKAVKEVLKTIEGLSNYRFFYNSDLPLLRKQISIIAENKSINEVMDEIVSGTPYTYKLFENNLVVISSGEEIQQPRTVTGKVTDKDTGEPLTGVNIVVEGTTTGVMSNVNGTYSIMVPNDNATLAFSFVGYNTQRMVVSSKATIDIVLVSTTSVLEEVVVIGYGTQKKITITGAVGNIQAAEIIKSPTSSINNALAGRAAGIVTIQSTSRPGQDFAEIFIRGRATTGSTSPLILVDGIERDITLLDPNEVESLNVLKDASATAVFGVRGANGVIVVTTKTGKYGLKPQISFSANYGFQNYTRVPRLLPATEYMKMVNLKQYTDAANKSTFVPAFSGEDIELWRKGVDPIFHPDIDWFDYMMADWVPTSQENLNISGGTKKAKYFVSLGHYGATGFFKHGDLEDMKMNDVTDRYNIRVNTDFQWTKDFSTSVKFSTQISQGDGTANDFNSILNNTFSSGPIVGQPLVDGYMIQSTEGLAPYKTIEVNPYTILYGSGERLAYSSRTNVDLTMRYELNALTKGLSVRGKFAYDNYYTWNTVRNRNYQKAQVVKTPGYAANDYSGNYYTLVQTVYAGAWYTSSESYSQTDRLYGEAALEYNNTFEGGHTLSALLLGTMERSFKPSWSDGTTVSPALPFNYMGLVGRLTYNYHDRYMGEVNMGYNGSENFKKGHQFGFFPSFSLGYVISEENFFPKNNILTFLKLRGSYGKVGNDNIGKTRFNYTPSVYGLSNSYFFGTSTLTTRSGYIEGAAGNPDISWEVAKKSDIALDLKFFHDQVTLTVDLFKEKRDGIFGQYNNVPYTYGDLTKLPSFNLGKVENKGYEIEAGFKSKGNPDFQYWVNGNFSFARNKRVYFDEIPPAYENLAATGYPIGQPYRLQVIGFYTSWDEINDPTRPKSIWETSTPIQPGDFKYLDVTGDGIINTNDRLPLGYSNIPEIFYGFSAGIKYKNFDVNFLAQGAAHVNTEYGGATFGMGGYGAIMDVAYEQWSMERYLSGDNIKYPRPSNIASGHDFQSNTSLVENARYLRLKNIEIGYNFTKGVLKKFGIETLRPYINGQNLLTATPLRHWDPETVRAVGAIDRAKYPVSRIINFGVRANF